ncbi:bifunctional 3'-5' exonuclease/DNA polymerase, partial [Streptomyces sp. NPDC056730]
MTVGRAPGDGGSGPCPGSGPGSGPDCGSGCGSDHGSGYGFDLPGARPGAPAGRVRPSLSDPPARLGDMTERWALAPAESGGALLVPLGTDGRAAGPVVREPDLVAAVRARLPEVGRWVWRSTAEVYPRLLAAGVRVERCYDIEAAELLLL